MEHPEKLERINPALVDKMIRTEDAVARGQAELAKQELLRPDPPDDGRDPVTGRPLEPAAGGLAAPGTPAGLAAAGTPAGAATEALPPADQWLSAGGVMVLFGALLVFLDVMGSSLLILAWLGGFQRPLGIMLVVAGVAIIAARVMAGVPISRLWKNSSNQSNARRRARR